MATRKSIWRRRSQSIAMQWAKSTLSITLLLQLLLISATLFFIQQSYYGSVRNSLENAANNPNAPVVLMQSYSGQNLTQNEVSMISNFSEQYNMTVWLYDMSGNIILSSEDDLDEKSYIPKELGSLEDIGKASIARLPSGEQIMTIAVQLSDENGSIIGSVRYSTSLREVNRQILIIAGMLALFLLISVGAIALAGRRFVRTILLPIDRLAETAEKIAMGDLRARVPSMPRSDEFALLGITMNAMADNLEESNRLKNDFISTISHELRTPLTVIRGWSETMQAGDSNQEFMKRGLGIILNESTRLEKMVEELLDFSRIQSGRMTLRRVPLDILAELDEVVFTIKENALRAGVTVRQKVPEFPVRMEGDPDRLRQVFINIIDNAVKYNSPGGWVEITARAEDDPKHLDRSSHLEIIIEDNGRGIPEEHLRHIKEKFYKVSGDIRGSGIGLAIADEIIRLHGGTLEIGSTEGEGTQVIISLPVDKILLPELPDEIINLMEEKQVEE